MATKKKNRNWVRRTTALHGENQRGLPWEWKRDALTKNRNETRKIHPSVEKLSSVVKRILQLPIDQKEQKAKHLMDQQQLPRRTHLQTLQRSPRTINSSTIKPKKSIEEVKELIAAAKNTRPPPSFAELSESSTEYQWNWVAMQKMLQTWFPNAILLNEN